MLEELSDVATNYFNCAKYSIILCYAPKCFFCQCLKMRSHFNALCRLYIRFSCEFRVHGAGR